MSLNKAILIGNVGKDPEVRHLDNGTPVCTFTLATNEVYTNNTGEKIKTTEWHNIVLWRKLAETAEKYVKKGDPLYIEGKIRSRSYDGKDGIKRYVTEIVADTFQFVGRKADSGPNEPERDANVSDNKINDAGIPLENAAPVAVFDESPNQDSGDLPF